MIFIKVLEITIWHLKNKKYTKEMNQQAEGMTLFDNQRILEMKPSITMDKRESWPNVQLRLLLSFNRTSD